MEWAVNTPGPTATCQNKFVAGAFLLNAIYVTYEYSPDAFYQTAYSVLTLSPVGEMHLPKLLPMAETVPLHSTYKVNTSLCVCR